MNSDFINLTAENLADEHLCCIIRSKKLRKGPPTDLIIDNNQLH